MECPGAHFHVVGLQNDAASLRPIFLQRKNQILKGAGRGGSVRPSDARGTKSASIATPPGGVLRLHRAPKSLTRRREFHVNAAEHSSSTRLRCTKMSASFLHLIHYDAWAPVRCPQVLDLYMHRQWHISCIVREPRSGRATYSTSARTHMTPADVLKLIKEKDAKFVDLRFTDTIGKEQHVTIPTRLVDEGFFKDGKMFDGSSIAGWKGINESDMILMPDPATAVIDPFYEETTVNLRCDVIEPMTMQGYERDPRSLAKRAEAYLKVFRHRRFGAVRTGKRILHFRQRHRQFQHERLFLRSRLLRGRLEFRQDLRGRQQGRIGPASRAATFRCRRWIRSRTFAPPCPWPAKKWA